MNAGGIQYSGAVYRPPSEAYSLIIQATLGCSHNKCAFCNMYKAKNFSVRPLQTVLAELAWARRQYARIPRIFLADGDALILPMDYLMTVLSFVRKNIPECERVSVYGSPKSILGKSEEELNRLHVEGLGMVYMGLETGNEALLKKFCKGQPVEEVIHAGKKIKNSGIALSVTAISGLGGLENWEGHAVDTGKALSTMNPDYIGLLTLRVYRGTPLAQWVEEGSITLMDPLQLARETRLLLENTDSEGSVFRSNHASNYLVLKGTLNRDKPRLLAQLDEALEGKRRFRSQVELGF